MSQLSLTRSLLASSLLSATSLLGIAPALAYDEISSNSPFVGCDVSSEPGTLFTNAEVEPWVDVNPTNTNNMIAGWQQDRWSNGGARSLMSAYSADGGATWTRIVVPGINKCTNGAAGFSYDRSTDPWVTFAPDGTAYFMSLSFNNDLPTGSRRQFDDGQQVDRWWCDLESADQGVRQQ